MPDHDSSHPRCELCDRFSVPSGKYCILHETAITRVKESFGDWQKALGDISWERYLERILGLRETGDSSKEIARHLLAENQRLPVKVLEGD